MSMRSLITLLVACPLAMTAIAADEGPGLGEAVSAEHLAAVDFTIMPDGNGLPAGSGNAIDGRLLYESNCLACHGEKGSGGINDTLAGGRGSLTSQRPQKTVGSYWPYATTVFDYIRRAMPFQTPDVLRDEEVYAVTAYLLFINGIIDEDQVMDAQSLPAVQMPNRENFVWGYTPK